MTRPRSKGEKLAQYRLPDSVAAVNPLTHIEVKRRISRLMMCDPTYVAQIASAPEGHPCLDILIARIIMKGMTSLRPTDAVACVEWLMQRSIGKVEQGEIDQGDRKITFITSIAKDGTVSNEMITAPVNDEN